MTCYKVNDYTLALELWQNALEITQLISKEEYPNFNDEWATLNANIGTAHKHLSHPDEAISFFRQSIALREEKHGINCKEAQKSRQISRNRASSFCGESEEKPAAPAFMQSSQSLYEQDCNPLDNASPRFFKETDKLSSIKPRKGLKNEVKLTQVLEQHLPAGLTLGKAHSQGDCFFDALAQCLNRMNNTDVNTDKYLRMLCHDYYEKNKAFVDKLNAQGLWRYG